MPSFFAFGTGAADAYSQIKKEERAGNADKEKEKRALADNITLINARVGAEDEITRKREAEKSGRLWDSISKQFQLPAEAHEAGREQFLNLNPEAQKKLVDGALFGGVKLRDDWAQKMKPPEAEEVDFRTGESVKATARVKRPMSLGEIFQPVEDVKELTTDKVTAAAMLEFFDLQKQGIDPYQTMLPGKLRLIDEKMKLSERTEQLYNKAFTSWVEFNKSIMINGGQPQLDFGKWYRENTHWAQYAPQFTYYEKDQLMPQGWNTALASETSPPPPSLFTRAQQQREVALQPPPEPVTPPSSDNNIYTGGDTREGDVTVASPSGSTEVRRVRPEKHVDEVKEAVGVKSLKGMFSGIRQNNEEWKQREAEKMKAPVNPIKETFKGVPKGATPAGMTGLSLDDMRREKPPAATQKEPTQEARPSDTELKQTIEILRKQNPAMLEEVRKDLKRWKLNPKDYGL